MPATNYTFAICLKTASACGALLFAAATAGTSRAVVLEATTARTSGTFVFASTTAGTSGTRAFADATSGASAPAEHAPPSADARIAVTVFLDYEDNVMPARPARELRLEAARRLAQVFSSAEGQARTSPEIDPLLQEWSIRSELDLSDGYLAALAEGRTERLVVARLVLYRDRVLLLARGIRAPSGSLEWADVAEVHRSPAFETPQNDWDQLVGEVGGEIRVRWRTSEADGDARTLVVLPFRTRGLAAQADRIALHGLLVAILDRGRWVLPDPALAWQHLRSLGRNPRAVDAGARRALEERFAPLALVAPSLLPFAEIPAGPSSRRAIEADDGAGAAGAARVGRLPLYLQLVLIDPAGGHLRFADGVHLPADDPTGLFGFEKHQPLARRLEDGARRILRRLEKEEVQS